MQFLKSPLPHVKVQIVQGPRFSDKQNSDRKREINPDALFGG